MNQFFVFPFREWPFVLLVLMISFTAHEFAHAYSADRFGDDTARKVGRVTLKPTAHMDVFGTLLFFVAGFGWAKPVPVVRSRFKYPRVMGVTVSVLGPISNLLIAFVGMLLVYILAASGVLHSLSAGELKAVYLFFSLLIQLNLILFIFNLIPLPPLDGYRVIEDLAPVRVRERMRQMEQWTIFIFLLIILVPALRQYTLDPLFSLSSNIFMLFNRILAHFFGTTVNWIQILLAN